MNLFFVNGIEQSIDNIKQFNFQPNNTIRCTICKEITNIIQDEIGISNSSIVVAENIVKFICDTTLPKKDKVYCDEILNDIEQIQKYIINGLNTTQICKKIGMC